MPELPEVETIARTLRPGVEGRVITKATLLNTGTLEGDVELAACEGARLGVPGRRGKLLLLPFADNAGQATGLAFHLRMTGRLFLYTNDMQPEKHTRAIFDLDDGQRLFFDDARKFGLVRVLTPENERTWTFWNNLGPEPLAINAKTFAARFAGKRGRMKSLLLDQTVIAGVGNIYADESLFRAGIHPAARAVDLPLPALMRLHGELREVLEESIDACGSSIKDYRTARGDAGAFQNAFRVYGRAGKACVTCKQPLERLQVAGRTTVCCPRCQPLP